MSQVGDYIKSYVSLQQVVEMYVSNLKKKGSYFMGSCPLGHKDKTPSLCLKKNAWHCFSCGAGGDQIKLVMLAEGIGFVEACKALVERFQVPAPVYVRNRLVKTKIRELEEEGRTGEAKKLLSELL